MVYSIGIKIYLQQEGGRWPELNSPYRDVKYIKPLFG
jgi:hypothetical protein